MDMETILQMYRAGLGKVTVKSKYFFQDNLKQKYFLSKKQGTNIKNKNNFEVIGKYIKTQFKNRFKVDYIKNKKRIFIFTDYWPNFRYKKFKLFSKLTKNLQQHNNKSYSIGNYLNTKKKEHFFFELVENSQGKKTSVDHAQEANIRFLKKRTIYKHLTSWIINNYRSFNVPNKHYNLQNSTNKPTIVQQYKKKNQAKSFSKKIRVLLYCLRLLPYHKNYNYKKRLLFFNLLFKSLNQVLLMLIIHLQRRKKVTSLITNSKNNKSIIKHNYKNIIYKKYTFLKKFNHFSDRDFLKNLLFFCKKKRKTISPLKNNMVIHKKKHINLFKQIFLVARKQNKVLLKKLIFLHNIIYLQLSKFKSTYTRYNEKLLQPRMLLLNLYSKILLFSLHKVSFIQYNTKLTLNFFALNNKNVNANFLVSYIMIKLSQYFTINAILNPIIRKYKRTGFIHGFRFLITGRLTRKERATHLMKSYKAMPYASPSIKIDHASDFKIMRFGVVGIKISLLAVSRTPYHYFFQFKNQL